MPREICLLNDSFPPLIDGVANTVVNYAKNLGEMGYGVSVVTPELEDADDSAFPYPVVRYPSLDLREQIGYTAGIPIAKKVNDMLGDRHVELLHSHCPVASNYMARALRELWDAPMVMTYHTKFDEDIANAVRGKLLQESAIKLLVSNIQAADEVWVVSNGAGENLRSLGYTGEYVVMENGVDVPRKRLPDDKVHEHLKEYDLQIGVPVFLFVGRMMWYKGQRIILDALAALKSQNLDYRMVFVGKGTEENEIKEYAVKAGVMDKCIFTGPIYERERLMAWYCRADLFLFPSTFDTNGLVVREAAACSLGSVLIGGSCAAEGVTAGHNGLIIEENAASLAVCLARIMDDKERMARIGQNAADELYVSWADSVKHASERYEVVIDRYRSGHYARKPGLGEGVIKMESGLIEWNRQRREKSRLLKKNAKELADKLGEKIESSLFSFME